MHACSIIDCINTTPLFDTAVAIVAIDVSKLFLLFLVALMHACLIIYCITTAMLNTAVAILAIDVIFRYFA